MVARVLGLVDRVAGVACIDFSRIPVVGEDSLSFLVLSDGMSLFNRGFD